MINDCKVPNPLTYNTVLNTYELRTTMNQNDRIKILMTLEHTNLHDVFPNLYDDKIEIFNIVMLNFYKLWTFVKSDHTESLLGGSFDGDQLNLKLKNWLSLYIRCTDGENITPYLHIFVYHSVEFIKKYKHLNLFSTQSVEHWNHFNKRNYFTQTNRRTFEFMRQLLDKTNRTEFTHLGGTVDEIYEKIALRNSTSNAEVLPEL